MEKVNRGINRLIHWQYFPLLVLLVVILGLHLATITHPNEPLFDEQHYIPDARRIINGEGTQRVEHPPLAKLIIAGGIEVFGDNPWGWRMPAVILSTIALIAFYSICRKLGGSHKTAFLATMFLGLENLMFLHSGMAMLDIYVVVFTIFAFWLYLKGMRWWWASAICIALAGLSKFGGVLAVIPIGLHWFLVGYKPNMGVPGEVEPSEPVIAVVEPAQPPVALEAYSTGSTVEIMPEAVVPPSAEASSPVIETKPEIKKTFWKTYSRPIVFIASMLLALIAFFLLYGVFEMIIWTKYIPFVVWGHWDQGVVGDIKNALTMTDSIKFSYSGAFPAKPWEWVLSPSGSFYFYGWLVHPENYSNILLPYWYTPSYTGIISPSLWLAGLFVIPYVAVKSFIRKNNPEKNAAIFTACWIIGTWVVWIPLFLASDRITYMFYYLPTVGAIALGTALVVTGFLKRIEKRSDGFGKRFMQLGIATFLLFHLLSFCVLSPLHLWISIPVCTMLLFFALDYLGFGWRFDIEFYICAGIAAVLIRFALYWLLRGWFVTGNAPWGLPEVSMLWVVGSLIGFVITWVLFALLHSFVNRVKKDNALPLEAVVNPPQNEIAPT
jgi:hypothetical protein